LKVALICTEKLPVPPIAGGAVQLYIEGIVPYLSQKHDITVFSIQFPGLPEHETVNNVKYVRVPASTKTLYIGSLRAALDNSFDLIHVFNRPRYVLELMEKLPGVRFGLSLHNEMFHSEKISDADALRCIDRVDYINSVSKYIANTVTARFPSAESKLRVVYSGVNSDIYKPVWSTEGLSYRNQLKRKLGLQDHKVVLFVGRLSVKKGVDVLLKAMDQVMRSNPKTALVIIGSKWYGKNEEDDYTKSLRVISANLAGPIVFTGFIPPADIPQYFTLGDVFVCASQWMEPLARVHYEAMAAGLPIITTNRGGNAEVVAGYGNGFVIDDYSNPSVMAQKISYLLNNEVEALKMGGSGRRLAERQYTWERVANEVSQAFVPNIQPSVKSVTQAVSPVKAAPHAAPPVKAAPIAPFELKIDIPEKTQAVVPPDNTAGVKAATRTVNPAEVKAAARTVNPAEAKAAAQQFNPFAVKAAAQPVNPFAVKAAAQPVNPFAVKAAAQPVNPFAVKAAAQPVNPFAVKAAAQPVNPFTVKAAAQPVNPFAVKAAAQPVNPFAVKAAAKPVGWAAVRAAAKPASWEEVKAAARPAGSAPAKSGQPDRPTFSPSGYVAGWPRKQP
jgi:spore coat protein SA